jgi:hypothetical protein
MTSPKDLAQEKINLLDLDDDSPADAAWAEVKGGKDLPPEPDDEIEEMRNATTPPS